MFSKGNDLARDYPEIAAFVEQNVQISAHYINGFLFKRRVNSLAGNLFRFKGEMTRRQILALKLVHKVEHAKNLIVRKNKDWTEYSLPVGLGDILLADTYTSGSYNRQLDDVLSNLGDDDDREAVTYVNGRMVDSNKRRYDAIRDGDTVVVLSDPDDFAGGSFLPFSETPSVRVYQQKLMGPFGHEGFYGLWPKEITREARFRRAFGLRPTDEAICPTCGTADCDDHILSSGSKVYFRRPGTSQYLYTFASARMIGDDASELLTPFAPLVLDRRVTGTRWPGEIYALEIDDRDHTNSTCGEDIDPGSDILVILANPRRHISR